MVELRGGHQGKVLRIILNDGEIIEGLCIGYNQAIDNIPEEDSLDIKKPGPYGNSAREIFKHEIKSIEIL